MQMPNQVTLKPSDHAFTVKAGETILDAALRKGFVISYGCRNGACGTCKGKVLSGTVDYGNHQASALPESEKRQGFALFCQARPLGDVVIECREVGATRDIQIRTLPARVHKVERVADDVAATQPDLLLIKGGIVSLPFGEDLEIVGFPLPRGQTYACMAEAMLLGLEGIFDRTFTGSLNRHHVDQARAMAARHGFQLADFKRRCVLGGTRKEESYALRR